MDTLVMLRNFSKIFDGIQGAKRKHSLSYDEAWQRRRSQKDIKITNNN